MNSGRKIYVAGHLGLVGSALVRRLHAAGCHNIVTATRDQVDLTISEDVLNFYDRHRPEYVFIAAAKVGGVCSNNRNEASFLLDNLKIQNNLIEGAHLFGAKKLLFLGSACVYPRCAPEPVTEQALLTGPLEPSNQWYAVAKIAGLKLCQAYRRQHGCDFISAMPTNLYGMGDKYDLRSCHVLPALLRRFHEAKVGGDESVTCWGTGAPRREFLYSEDCADACITLMNHYSGAHPVNIGTGSDMTIAELARAVADTVGYPGQIVWDTSKPDGTPRRLLDTSKIAMLGWSPKVVFKHGLRLTYQNYVESLLPPDLIYDSVR